jgi:DeoR/GlpR family transcriptional regulator of sugar metabolism
MHIDVYFMGVTGVHLQAGLTTGDYEEAALKRALHAQAAETVVLTSPEKLGAVSPYVIAPLSAISILGLNHVPDAVWQSAAAQYGIGVLLADSE